MILVTGATGNNGSEIVRQLSAAGVRAKALVRNRAKAAALALPGIELVEGDFTNVDSLVAALQGVEKALLLTPYAENQVEMQSNFIDAARRAGVKHIVKFSVMGADADSPCHIFKQHGQIEQILAASGLAWTNLRPNSFMQNFLEYAGTIAQGAIYAAMNDQPISFVDIRDIAAVAVKVLTGSGHEGNSYVITGPEGLSHQQAAEKIGAAIGKRVTFVPVTPEQASATLLGWGLPQWMVTGIDQLYALYRQGAGAPVTDTVARIAGKAPIPFDQFARDYAQALQGQ